MKPANGKRYMAASLLEAFLQLVECGELERGDADRVHASLVALVGEQDGDRLFQECLREVDALRSDVVGFAS